MQEPAPRRDDPGGLAIALFAVLAIARAVVVLGQATAEDAAQWRTPWLLPALLGQDALLAVAYGLGARLGARLGSWAPAAAYALLAAWTAINVPVAFVMSSPLTASFVHAADAALGDSLRRYMTPLNLGAPLGLLALAWVLRRAPRIGRRPAAALLGAALALAALAPAARRRVDTRGLERNAAITFLETTWRQRAAPRAARRPPCAPTAGAAGVDLRALAGAAAGRHVLWVILESTGARHLPFLAASGARGTTAAPHLGALAEHAVVFDRAYAAYPESIKGLFSMLCSRAPPPDSEAAAYGADRIPCAPVPARLRAAGYRTALFHSGRFAYLGMDAVVRRRGFDTLADAAVIPSAYTSSFGVDDAATAAALLRWIDEGPRDRPFFAVYMPIAGHHPYHAPGAGPRPFPERSLADEHRNDVFAGDDAFGRLRRGLAARGFDERTLYVVAGDHGEAFREHAGNVAHALHLFEENVHVPLFVAAPGLLRGRRHAPQLASLLDLGPTTLALLGLPLEADHEGRPALDPAPRVVRFFTEQAFRRAGLVDGDRKLIVDQDAGRARVYDLRRDPRETRDLADEEGRWIESRRRCLASPADLHLVDTHDRVARPGAAHGEARELARGEALDREGT